MKKMENPLHHGVQFIDGTARKMNKMTSKSVFNGKLKSIFVEPKLFRSLIRFRCFNSFNTIKITKENCFPFQLNNLALLFLNYLLIFKTWEN